MIFSYLIGNNDGHIKNLSLVYHRDSSVSLAPFYDLVCTEIYPDLSKEMAISFGCHYVKDEIDESDFYSFSNDLFLKSKCVFNRLDEFIQILPKAIVKAREIYGDKSVIAKISNNILKNIDTVKKKILLHTNA